MPEWATGLLLFAKDLALGIYLTFFTGRWIQWLDSRNQAQRAIARIQKRVGDTSTELPLRAWADLSKAIVEELHEVSDALAWRDHRVASDQVMDVANEIMNQALHFYGNETTRRLALSDGASMDQVAAQMMIVAQSTDAGVSVRWEIANWLDHERKRLERQLGKISPSVPVILLLPKPTKIEELVGRMRRYFFETGEWRR